MSKSQQKLLVVPVGKGRSKKAGRTIEDDIDTIAPPKVDEPPVPTEGPTAKELVEKAAAHTIAIEAEAALAEQSKPKRKRTMTAAAQESLKRANEARMKKKIEREIRDKIAAEQRAEEQKRQAEQELERRLESKMNQWMARLQQAVPPPPPPPPPSPESDEYSDSYEQDEVPAGYVRNDVPRQMNQRPPQLRHTPLPGGPVVPSIVSGYWG